MNYKDLTIIVASFKSDQKIRMCLKSIDINYKILVVENSSDQNFKENIQKEYINPEVTSIDRLNSFSDRIDRKAENNNRMQATISKSCFIHLP